MVRRAIICSPVRLAVWCGLTPQICACRMRTIGLKACDGSSIRGHIDAILGDDPREESPAVIHCTRIRCRPSRVSKGPWPCSPEDFRHTPPFSYGALCRADLSCDSGTNCCEVSRVVLARECRICPWASFTSGKSNVIPKKTG